METINQAIHNHLKPLYIQGCEPLDDVEGRRVKVAIGTSTSHTNMWIHRQIINGCRQQLKDEVIVLHGSRARVPTFAMPTELDRETMEYKPLSKNLNSSKL